MRHRPWLFGVCVLNRAHRLDLVKKIRAAEGTEKERSAIAAKLEAYRRDVLSCEQDFAVCVSPIVHEVTQACIADDRMMAAQLGEAIVAAGQDATAVKAAKERYVLLPSTFPKRDIKDDRSLGLEDAPKAPGAGASAKRKAQTKAQKAFDAMLDELSVPAATLPSMYHSKVRQHHLMKKLVETERSLRQGQAAEALNELRIHLSTHVALKFRKEERSGQNHNAPMDRRLDEKKEVITGAKYEYRKLRHTLRVLGMPENHKIFRPLRDEDAVAFKLFTSENVQGDSRRMPSWIWGDFSFVGKVAPGEVRTFLEKGKRLRLGT